MNEIEQMLTDREVAQVLKMSRSSVWRLARLGKLPNPVKVGLTASRWKQSELKTWIDSTSPKCESPTGRNPAGLQNGDTSEDSTDEL